MNDNKLMEAALGYVRRGWKVIPLHNWEGSKCSCNKAGCESAGKHPRIAWKENATIDEGQIQEWWLRWPEANVGVVTGAKSGLVVIDLDGPTGEESFRRLSQEHDYTCDTIVSKTGNGCHLYYKHPGSDISNSARTVADGVDVRGDGGYIVSPPSMHKSGRSYRWRQDERQLQELPPWLHEALQKSKCFSRQVSSAVFASSSIPQGGRNSHLTSLAGTMRHRGLSEAVMAAALLEENRKKCSPPLSESEVRQIAQSVSRYEAASNGGSKSDETISQRLIRLADQASFFHSPDGEAFASVVHSSGKLENWPTNSKDFTTWLTRCYWQETKSAP